MKHVMKRIIKAVVSRLKYYKACVITWRYSYWFKSLGEKSIICGFNRLIGSEYISIGDKTKIGRYATLTAWDKVGGMCLSPHIKIGNSCNIGEYCHITCVNEIEIGNHVLTGRWITISDNSHGTSTLEDMKKPPLKRKIYTRGGIKIGDNVWIGDKATILPGVHIGEGSIVAANCVVTKDVPAYSVVAGNPGRIVKTLKDE